MFSQSTGTGLREQEEMNRYKFYADWMIDK